MFGRIKAFLKAEDGIFPFVLGGALGGIGSAVVGAGISSVVGGFFDRRNARKDYQQQRDLGFTHSEIAGAGGAGAGTASETTLGNQFNTMQAQKRQMAYDAMQRDLDRAVAVRGQDFGLASAQTSAGASIYSSDTQAKIAEGKLALDQKRFNEIQLPQALNDIATSTPDWKRQELLAKMGVDNTIATVITTAYGIDIMNREQLQSMSTAEFENLVRQIHGLQSTIFRETAGVTGIVERGARDVGASLGSGSRGMDPGLFRSQGSSSLGNTPVPVPMGRYR